MIQYKARGPAMPGDLPEVVNVIHLAKPVTISVRLEDGKRKSTTGDVIAIDPRAGGEVRAMTAVSLRKHYAPQAMGLPALAHLLAITGPAVSAIVDQHIERDGKIAEEAAVGGGKPVCGPSSDSIPAGDVYGYADGRTYVSIAAPLAAYASERAKVRKEIEAEYEGRLSELRSELETQRVLCDRQLESNRRVVKSYTERGLRIEELEREVDRLRKLTAEMRDAGTLHEEEYTRKIAEVRAQLAEEQQRTRNFAEVVEMAHVMMTGAGVPDKGEKGVRLTMVERIQWLVSNGAPQDRPTLIIRSMGVDRCDENGDVTRVMTFVHEDRLRELEMTEHELECARKDLAAVAAARDQAVADLNQRLDQLASCSGAAMGFPREEMVEGAYDHPAARDVLELRMKYDSLREAHEAVSSRSQETEAVISYLHEKMTEAGVSGYGTQRGSIVERPPLRIGERLELLIAERDGCKRRADINEAELSDCILIANGQEPVFPKSNRHSATAVKRVRDRVETLSRDIGTTSNDLEVAKRDLNRMTEAAETLQVTCGKIEEERSRIVTRLHEEEGKRAALEAEILRIEDILTEHGVPDRPDAALSGIRVGTSFRLSILTDRYRRDAEDAKKHAGAWRAAATSSAAKVVALEARLKRRPFKALLSFMLDGRGS